MTIENIYILILVLLVTLLVSNLSFFGYLRLTKYKRRSIFKRTSINSNIEEKFRRLNKEKGFNFKNFKESLLNIWRFLYRRKSLKTIWVISNVILIAILGFFNYKFVFNETDIVETSLAHDEVWEDMEDPIIVKFNKPVRKEDIEVALSADIEINVESKDFLFFGSLTREIEIIAKKTALPGESMSLIISDIKSFFGGSGVTEEFEISTNPPVQIIDTFPADGDQGIPINTEIQLKTDYPVGNHTEWEVIMEPSVPYKVVNNENEESMAKIVFEEKLSQETNYTLQIFRKCRSYSLDNLDTILETEMEEVGNIAFQTVIAPTVLEYLPEDPTNVLADAEIKAVFNQPMDVDSVKDNFVIEPAIDGEINWAEDNKIFTFKPESFPKETDFRIQFNQGILSEAGGFSEQISEFLFSTIGKVKVIDWKPQKGSTGVPVNNTVEVTFDQEIDHESAEASFSISPKVEGEFSWYDNKLIFTPKSDLEDNAKLYTVKIAPGVKTVNGLDSEEEFTSTFKTAYSSFSLKVPLYMQPYPKSCNITSAKMVLAYRGVSRSVDSIFNGIAKDTTPCNPGANTWGNPNAGYVGSLGARSTGCIYGDGSSDGYGVHWGPIASYIKSQGVSASAKTGMSVKSLVQEIKNGHPVIIWEQHGATAATNISWKTPDGTTVHAVKGMHSEVAIGFVGDENNPTHITLNDPWRGRRTVSVSYFDKRWSYYGRSGVVVY